MNNNITEDYVSFEIAKLLKEKGFTWLDHNLIAKDGKLVLSNPTGVPTSLDNGYNCYEENGVPIRPRKYTPTNTHYPRPTHALAVKWIRENFHLDISTRYVSWPHLNEEKWTPHIDTMIKYEKGRADKESLMIMLANEKSQYLANEAALLYTLQNLIP